MGVIALLGCLGLGRIAYGPQEDRTMRTANEYAEPLQKQLDHDPRLRHVTVIPVNVGASEPARIHFSGYVKTDEDLETLHRVVKASKPSLAISYFIEVRSKEKTNTSPYLK